METRSFYYNSETFYMQMRKKFRANSNNSIEVHRKGVIAINRYYAFNHEKYMRLLYENCMSQKQLAKKAGLSHTGLSGITTKHKQPSRKTIAKMAKGFGVDFTELLEGEKV